MKNIFLVSTAILILTGCSNNKRQDATAIVNLSEAVTITVDSADIVQLETSDSSLLYSLGDVLFQKDKFTVISRGNMKTFDYRGRYLNKVGSRGQGPEEYTNINSAWITDSVIYIYDSNTSKILGYTPEGSVAGTTDVSVKSDENIWSPSQLFYLGGGKGYLSVNTWMGGTDDVPLFSFIPPTLDSQTPVSGKLRLDGGWLNDGVFVDEPNDRVLYWEGFRDTVYTVDQAAGLSPLFVFDFGDKSLPQEIKSDNDLYNRIGKVQEAGDSVYAYARYIQAHNGNIYALTTLGSDIYIIKTDEKSKESKSYKLTFAGNRYVPSSFMKLRGDSLAIGVYDRTDTEKNPAIVFIPLSDLK